MGFSKTLYWSVSGQGISGLLHSGVHLSLSSIFIYSFHFVSLFGKLDVRSSKFLLFSMLLFLSQSPNKCPKMCHFCPGNVIPWTRFLDWVNWKGEHPSVAAPLPLSKMVSELSVQSSLKLYITRKVKSTCLVELWHFFSGSYLTLPLQRMYGEIIFKPLKIFVTAKATVDLV